MAHMANQLKMCQTLSCKSWLMIGHQCRWMIDVLWLFDVLVLGFQLFFLLWCFVGPKRGCNVPKPISTIKEASIVLIVLYTPRPRKGKLFIAKKCHLCQGRGVFARFFPEGRKKKTKKTLSRSKARFFTAKWKISSFSLSTYLPWRCQDVKDTWGYSGDASNKKNPENWEPPKKGSLKISSSKGVWDHVSSLGFLFKDRNHGATGVKTQYTIYLPVGLNIIWRHISRAALVEINVGTAKVCQAADDLSLSSHQGFIDVNT